MTHWNLGCSDDVKKGFINIDRGGNVDIRADLRMRWPGEDSSVDFIYAKDVLEHLIPVMDIVKELGLDGPPLLVGRVDIDPIVWCMNEAHRVLKPGGTIEIIVPCLPGVTPWVDPTHHQVWTEDTRYYFDERWNHPTGERGRLGPDMGITALFRTVGGRSGLNWTPIQYAPKEAPNRYKLFLLLEAVKK
jgi:SAM-dependent methyltransferase